MPALWNTLRERRLLFLHSGWLFGSASTTQLPPSPLLAHSLTPSLSLPPPCSACSASPSPSSAAVLPSNQGLEQSEQGQSDSGSRLADDLLAGLESSEPRQLKWSLKLEPTCREGRREPARERKREGGRARMQLLCGDERAH